MNQVYPVLGTPHMGFLALILIGGLAGWIASITTASNHGLFTNILVGIAGSWIGSKLAEIFNIAVSGTLMHLAMAVVGSVVIIYLWRLVHSDNSLMGRYRDTPCGLMQRIKRILADNLAAIFSWQPMEWNLYGPSSRHFAG